MTESMATLAMGVTAAGTDGGLLQARPDAKLCTGAARGFPQTGRHEQRAKQRKEKQTAGELEEAFQCLVSRSRNNYQAPSTCQTLIPGRQDFWPHKAYIPAEGDRQ